MKRLVVIFLVGLFFTLTLPVAMAGWGFEDPVMCIAGQWLSIDLAGPTGVSIALPEGVPYGNAGNCDAKQPQGNLLPSDVVTVKGGGHKIKVEIHPYYASETVTVSYNGDIQERANNLKQNLVFHFDLP